MNLANEFLISTLKRFQEYKSLGEKTFDQLEESDFHFRPNESTNSMAIIIQHLAGNMLSRWTDFLHTDGEKTWRNRDEEFETKPVTKKELMDCWQQGWDCCLNAIANLSESDLQKLIYIRNNGLLVMDAINRQLAHYAYHIGQIIYLAKIIRNEKWNTLSIAKGQSAQYNNRMNIKG